MAQRRSVSVAVDRQLQARLMLRIVFYWTLCVVAVGLILLCREALSFRGRPLLELVANVYGRSGPALSVLLLLLPIVLLDVVGLSKRFLAPAVRLQQGLSDVAGGRPVQPLDFRDDPFWASAAGNFNRAAARLSQEGSERHSPTEEMPANSSESNA